MTGDAPAARGSNGSDAVLVRQFVAGAEFDGERLDRAIAQALGMTRAQAQQRLSAGCVTVDDAPAAKSQRLRSGQVVVIRKLPPPPPEPAPPPVAVRYEDEDLAVVAKPAGLVVHAGAGTTGPTLVDALMASGMPLAAGPDPERPGIVHRLDRGTSGLLIVAKSRTARTALVEMLKRREVQRRYWALVDGHPEQHSATIDAPIARDPERRTRFRVDPTGRPARTHYDVTATFRGVSQLSVRLETGRTHQVRVHLSAIGHPVTGDRVYGADPTIAAELGLDRPALHAEALCFTHPVTGTTVAVEEPLPDDLRRARAALVTAENPGPAD